MPEPTEKKYVPLSNPNCAVETDSLISPLGKRVKRDSTTQKSEILPEALALENASDLPGADIEIHDAAYATTADANSESNLSDASKSEIEPQEPLNAEDESLHSGTEIDAGEEEEPQTEINQSLDDWTTGKQDADHVTACKLDEKLNTQDKENLTASEPAPLSKEWSPTKSITSNKIAIASSDSDRLEEDAQGEAAANLDAEITSSVTASESDPEESAEEEEEDVAAEEQLENELHDAETELNTEEAEDDVLAEAESCSPDAASENVEDESDETESLEVEGAHHVEELVTESLSPLSKSFQSIMESSGKNEKAQAVVVDVAEVFEGASPTDSKEQEETQPPKPAPASSRFSKYSSFVTDDDTALLNSFLSSSKAKKAEREAQGSPEKALPIRMDSPKSPRNVLTEVDNNSSSPILSRPSVETLSASVKSDVVESSAEKQEETFEDNNASEIIPQKQDEDEDVETTRRSTRTRNTRTTTNINVRRPTGNEFVFLQRSEEQERMLTTKRNTKKNKGDALLAPHYIEWMKQQGNPELPASPPKKRSKTRGKDKASAAEPSSDSNSASTASSSVSEESAARPKKSVVWDEELAYYKEDTPEPEMELDESPAAPRSTRKATHDRMRAKQAAVATAKVIGTPVAKKTKSILITPAKSKSKETSHSESETAPSSAAIPPPFTVQIPAPSSESAIPKPKSLGPLLKKKSSTIPMAMLKKASATVTAPTESVAAEEAKGEKKTVALKGKIPTPKPRMRIGTPAPKRARNVL